MLTLDHPRLATLIAAQPYPLAFATVSGAHLYGFPSADSDVDLRGAHILPAAELLGLRLGTDTVVRSWVDSGTEMDLVTHDLGKFARLLLTRNGYVLEQLLSPLVVSGGPVHSELVALAPRLVTRHHAHHYHGFARTQWRLFESNGELKPLLYTFRVLLTGAHLMRTGSVVADLPTLLPKSLGYVRELVAAKASGEHGSLAAVSGAPPIERIAADITALHSSLTEAMDSSALPDRPSAEDALHDLLIRLRLP